MAVTFQSIGVGADGAGTSKTWNHTCTGTDLALVVGVAITDAGASPTATYNGTPMVLEVRRTLPVDGDQVCIFSQIAPATGTHAVVVSYGSSVGITGNSLSVTGADQADCVSQTQSATGTTPTNAITLTITSATNDLVFAVLMGIGGSLNATIGSGETEQWDMDAAGSVVTIAAFTEAGASSVVINPTLSGNTEWGLAAVSLQVPVVGGGASVVPIAMRHARARVS